MNYPPPYHTEHDEERLFAAIEAIQHATLIVPGNDGLDISFTPFLLDRKRRVLLGHVAARNPQSTAIDGQRVNLVFHGPHVYVSPRHNDNDDVPTWNYVNVHVTGTATVRADEDGKWEMMKTLVHWLEKGNAEQYLAHYTTRLRPMLRSITCFEVAIEEVIGRFKLGRNDPPELQQKTFSLLREETPPSLKDWLETLAP